MPQKQNTKSSNNNFGIVARFPRASPSDATQMGDTGVVPNHDNKQINRLSIDSGTEPTILIIKLAHIIREVQQRRCPQDPTPCQIGRSSPRPRCERSGRSKSRSRAPMGRRAFVPYPQDRKHPVSHSSQALRPFRD
ncbi:hypothetical protein DPMN_015827 [Dreissena polymorpha]|uniref:Uncharacterized protein n=1 Tax=Dreissena polymorpha TaxID=45954 RepID=A0A9D4S4U3_DREPO|nr:hypothetical protein DPMN_015827 [Dreissena polymorpha]